MMEHMGKKKPRPRRSFTREFKAEIVELCQRGDRSIGQVARDFDLTETAVRDWIRQAEVDTGQHDGLTSDEREELAALRRENRRLREDVDILKRATVHPFIEAEKQSGHNVKQACELLQVSRSAFYARRQGIPGPRAVRDAHLAARMPMDHRHARGTYGAPRIHAVLQQEGTGCGRRRVARLMRAAGLQGRHRRRRQQTTIVDPRAAMRPDLIGRDFTPDAAAIDTRWCGDITYLPTEEGRLYLATVIDIASRRVVGWATADHLRTELVADALSSACRRRRPAQKVIFHSDRGRRYSSGAFAELAERLGVRLSVGRKGQCWDNALAESFFATLKGELLDDRAWPSRAVTRSAVFEFIEGWYNLHRLHSSLGYVSPAAYEAACVA
ncbi:IS3 family transposase [Streptosporangium sp. NPDC050855]|uniref:IS3 family transposase n=1 Tax=Streptosporangium sp. NPDC050855 TaxID=3366194 RepID=UPI00378AD631